jgi:acyl-coenzyme A synthetase/AMP-(fatty) acid ligase
LREDIWRYGISVIEVVPALLRELLSRGVAGTVRDRAFASVRLVVVTGEELSEDLWREWFSVFPDLPLINAYGPTECSDDVSQWRSATPVVGNRVRIGKPLSGVRLYILDQHGNLAPQGVAGELVVGGMAVGRGYLNDPIQTAAAFVPDRFAARPGARAYKTGDLARWTVSGELEYLGRMDEQIKLRGFRIDLREIEAVLTAHPEVRECVILSHQERAEDTWISAHYVPVSAQGAAPRVLRNYLRSRLPDYMVPAMFIPLERLPLGPNGKVDRQALASIKRWQQESDERRLPAENNTEKRILEVWRGVLGTDEVGVEDDFFDVGGHSLMATQVAARVEQVFHVALPLRIYFERRTIRELATDIDAAVYSGECPVRQRIPRLPRLASPQATQ